MTHENFNLKLQLLGEIAQWGLSPKYRKYEYEFFVTFSIFCYTVLFSVTRPARTVALILTLNCSNDVPPKDGPFEGQDDVGRE